MITPRHPAPADAFRPHDNHWRNLHFRESVTRRQLQHVLLNHPQPLRMGKLGRWRHKHLGVGVYELWMEDAS